MTRENNLVIKIVSDYQVDGRGDIDTCHLEAIADDGEETRYAGISAYYSYLSSNKSSDFSISKERLRRYLTDDIRRGAVLSVEISPMCHRFSEIEGRFDWLQRQGFTLTPINVSHYREIVAMVAEIVAEQSA